MIFALGWKLREYMIRKQNMSKATQKTVRTLYAFPKFRISVLININPIFSERMVFAVSQIYKR